MVPKNIAMMKRLREVSEATIRRKNPAISYPQAHQVALDKYQVSRYSVYHAEVVQQLRPWFEKKFASFWGLE